MFVIELEIAVYVFVIELEIAVYMFDRKTNTALIRDKKKRHNQNKVPRTNNPVKNSELGTAMYSIITAITKQINAQNKNSQIFITPQ